MTIAPFSFRDFGEASADNIAAKPARSFLPHGRKKEEATPPPPPPPLFSQDDVKAAERDGYQRGFLDGVTEGKNIVANEYAQTDQQLTELVVQFAKNLTPLFATYRDMLKLAGQQVPELASAIAKKVAGVALEEKAYQVIEDIALRSIESMYNEPKCVIIVHESLQARLAEKLDLASSQATPATHISVIGDTTIALSNCRIEWKNGALIRDSDQLWQQVEQVIATMVSSNEQESDALCDALETIVTQPPNTPPKGA